MAPDPILTAKVMKLKWKKGISLADAWASVKRPKPKKDKKDKKETKPKKEKKDKKETKPKKEKKTTTKTK